MKRPTPTKTDGRPLDDPQAPTRHMKTRRRSWLKDKRKAARTLPKVKICSVCGTSLPIDSFHRRSAKSPKRSNRCKFCCADAQAALRHRAWMERKNLDDFTPEELAVIESMKEAGRAQRAAGRLAASRRVASL